MTENPNIKKEVLDFVIKHSANGGKTASLRDFADERGYDQKTVAEKVMQMYPALDFGVSPMVPWLQKRKTAEDMYDQWNAEPPKEIEECKFIDD